MSLINLELSTVQPQVAAMAAMGMDIQDPQHATEALDILYSILNKGLARPEGCKAYTTLGNKAYLPACYAKNGSLILRWGMEMLPLAESEYLKFSFSQGDTSGYPCPHINLVFSETPFSSGGKQVIYQVELPVRLKGNTLKDHSAFLTMAKTSTENAISLIAAVDPTAGMPYIDETFLGDEDIQATLVSAVKKAGSEQYGGGYYTLALVEVNGQRYKARVSNKQLAATLAGDWNWDAFTVPCTISKGKKFYSVAKVAFSPDHFQFLNIG